MINENIVKDIQALAETMTAKEFFDKYFDMKKGKFKYPFENLRHPMDLGLDMNPIEECFTRKENDKPVWHCLECWHKGFKKAGIQFMSDNPEIELSRLENKIKELSKPNKERDEQIRKLKHKQFELKKEICSKNIGRCFKRLNSDGKIINYIKILDVNLDIRLIGSKVDGYKGLIFRNPKDEEILTRFHIDGNNSPFKVEKIRSSIFDKSTISNIDDLLGFTYEEISQEEWNSAFEEINTIWVNYIKNISKKEEDK